MIKLVAVPAHTYAHLRFGRGRPAHPEQDRTRRAGRDSEGSFAQIAGVEWAYATNRRIRRRLPRRIAIPWVPGGDGLARRVTRWLGAIALLAVSGAAQAQGMVGGAFVSRSHGVELLAPGLESEKPVPILSRLPAGTRLRLADGGRLQLLYLQGGRREDWHGRAVVEVGATETRALAIRSDPQVKVLPAYLLEALTASALTRPGVQPRRPPNRGRAAESAARVQAVRDQYAALRQQSEDEEILPELYLIAALEGLGAYADLKAPFDELQRKLPESSALQGLRQRYQAVLEGWAKPDAKPSTR